MKRNWIPLTCSRLLLTFAITLFVLPSLAQEDNHRVLFYNGTVDYKRPNALNTIGGLLGVAQKGKTELGIEDKSIVPTLTNAITSAPSSVYRLNVQQGEAPERTEEEAYRLDVLLYNVMTYTGNREGAQANMNLTLVDLCTGKTVAQKKVSGYEVYTVITKAQGVTYLATRLNKEVRQFLWSQFPISGTIVQKGVEQNNGKVKDSQCYIDLAENYGAFEGMKLTVYIDEDGKLKSIGSLKVKEVMGEELSICSISKGGSKIEKALEEGKKIVVMTKTPKD